MDKVAGRDQLERLIRTIAEGIIIINRSGIYTFANTSAEKILGLKRSEIIGRSYKVQIWRYITVDGKPFPDDRLPFNRVMRTGRSVRNQEMSVIRPDETKITLSINAVPLRDEAGTIIGVAESFTDITDRKIAEKLLGESEERYRRLVEVSPDLIAVYNEWRFLYVNPAGATMLGASSPNELIGKPILSFVYPAYRKAIKDSFLRAQQGKTVGPVEEKFVRLDDKIIDVEVTAVPVIYQGRPSVQVVACDISRRKRDEKKLRESKELSDALNRINSAINSTLNFDVIMQRVVTESAKALRSETAGIALREQNYWVTRYVYGLPQDIVGKKISEDRAAITAIAAKTKEPVAVDDVLTDKRVNAEVMEKHGIRSFMVMPLMVRGEVIGALSFNYYAHKITFGEAQIDFARKLAASISLALENARLYSSERNIADTLQEALLTVPRLVPGVQFGYFYHSATVAARVGGDFYDLFELEHHKVGITIGDVSGKGLEAATLASLIKNTIKAYAYENSSPAAIISKTNNLAIMESFPPSFVTVFFGILDTVSGLLTYCSAGHPPAILKRETSVTTSIPSRSPIIGAFKDLEYEDNEVVLKSGDILVLYTDGVIEARHHSEFFGETRLIEFLRTLSPMLVNDIPKNIFKKVLEYASGILTDDVAIIAIKLEDSVTIKD